MSDTAQYDRDRLDAARYRKYRAMVIAGLAEPVSVDEFDADIDAAVVPMDVLQNPALWSSKQGSMVSH